MHSVEPRTIGRPGRLKADIETQSTTCFGRFTALKGGIKAGAANTATPQSPALPQKQLPKANIAHSQSDIRNNLYRKPEVGNPAGFGNS
jgi:hypothetical protein